MPDLATACVLVTIVLRLASETEATIPRDQQPSVSRTLSTSTLQWRRMPPRPPGLTYPGAAVLHSRRTERQMQDY